MLCYSEENLETVISSNYPSFAGGLWTWTWKALKVIAFDSEAGISDSAKLYNFIPARHW